MLRIPVSKGCLLKGCLADLCRIAGWAGTHMDCL